MILGIGVKEESEKILILLAGEVGLRSIKTKFDLLEVEAALGHLPEIILLDLDEPMFCWDKMQGVKNISGNEYWIGITHCPFKAYTGFKRGLDNVIVLPAGEEEMLEIASECAIFLRNEKETLFFRNHREHHFIKLEEIIYLRADNNTTDFYLGTAGVITAFKTLKTFETVLPAQFVRVHKSYIVNLAHIYFMDTGKKLCRLRRQQQAIPISKKYIPDFESFSRRIKKIQI